MSLTDLAWLSLAAYAVHMLEEFMLNWRDWARGVIRLPVTWPDFYMTNGIVVVLGIASASLAPTLPLAPMIFAALMLVAARLRHVAGTKWGTRKYLDMERLIEQNREEITEAVA